MPLGYDPADCAPVQSGTGLSTENREPRVRGVVFKASPLLDDARDGILHVGRVRLALLPGKRNDGSAPDEADSSCGPPPSSNPQANRSVATGLPRNVGIQTDKPGIADE